MEYEHYSLLADLFDFPGPQYREKAKKLSASLVERYPEAAVELHLFVEGIPESSNTLQEMYTRTFEIQSLTTLSIGYIMFGDDYKRGDLLANLNREHALAGNDCRGELADHLSNVLRLIPLIEDEGLLSELVSELLLPAVRLMAKEFDRERIRKKDANYAKHYKTLIEAPAGTDLTIFGRALEALLLVLGKDFPLGSEPAALASVGYKGSDFLGMIQKEMEEMEIESAPDPNNSGRGH